MNFQDNPYTPALFVNAVSLLALGLYTARRGRAQPSTKSFTAMMIAGAWWAFAYGLNWASASYPQNFFWMRATYLSIVFIPVFWFMFAQQYTTRGRWFSWRNFWFLIAIPCTTYTLIVTNDLHHLVWQNVSLERNADGYAVLRSVRNIWFWVHTAYSYILMVSGGILILRSVIRAPQNYRGQALPLILGVVVPWIINALTLAQLLPFPDLDLTPFTFTISGAAFGWSIFRYRLFDVVPVAHDVVIRTMRDGVIVLNAQQEIVDINPAAQQALNHHGDAADLLLKPFAQFVPSWVAPPTNAPQELEVTLNGDGNTWHPYSLRASPLQDRGGIISGYLLHLQDITKHKETQQALHQTEQLFYQTVEEMDDPYMEVDLVGNLVYVNNAFGRSLQYPKAELVGKNFRHFIARHDAKRMFAYFTNIYAAKTKHIEPLIYEYRRKDGTLGFGELSVSLVRDTQSKVVGARGIVRDISQRKRHEQALQIAKRAAEEASETKSAFLANVSHELRTPLTSLQGFSKLVQKRFSEVLLPRLPQDDSKVKRAIEQVEENLRIMQVEGERLMKLINDVLDLSKIETSRRATILQPVALGDVVAQAVAAQQENFSAKGLTLTTEIVLPLPPVLGNAQTLQQAVNYLLDNALKFTHQGSAVCRVWQSGDELVVSLRDTGIGIAEENLQKIFDRFTQIGDTLTAKPMGTGVGLSICKQIVEQHHGHIWAESELNKGSTFSFAIPLKPPSEI